MILWAKQHAWLSAEKGRLGIGALPPVSNDFLVVALLGAGPVEFSGFGTHGISPQRLESWLRLTGYVMTPWQAETVLEASTAYAVQMLDKKAPAPWSTGVDKIKSAAAIRQAFRRR